MTMDTAIQDAIVFPESSCSGMCPYQPPANCFIVLLRAGPLLAIAPWLCLLDCFRAGQ